MYIYIVVYPAMKKNEMTPFSATWVILNEVSQKKTVSPDITYMWNLKKKKYADELIYKTNTESQT